jgi:cytochrome c oxidase subunit 2
MGVAALVLLLAAVMLASGGCTFSPQTARRVATGLEVQKVKIVARNWEFVPSEIRVKAGMPVELKVYSADVDHGIEFTDLDVPVERIPAGRTVTVRFIPSKPGVYHFRCAVVCGTGHDEMKGILIVE